MPIGKIEVFNETRDDWNACVEQAEQHFTANEIKHRHAMRAEPMTCFFHNMAKFILTTYG